MSLVAALACAAGCGDSAQTMTEGTGTGASTGAGTGTGTSAGSTGEEGSTGTSGEPTSGSSGAACPANAPPEAPTVVDPVSGRLDVIAGSLSISGSPFVDADAGDVLGGVEAEIWRFKDGGATKRIWHAELAVGTLSPLTLADGAFDEGPLEDWTDYAIRLRYRDEHEACSSWGAWSKDRVFRTDDGSTELFDETVVRDFYLDIPPASWQALNAQAVPPGCVPFQRSYYTGTLRYGGETFPGVGIKTKGGCGTSRDLNGKASFKVNLEWDDPNVPGCPATRRLLGQTHFTFNNGVQDSSATHERLGYGIYRALGLPAPRAVSVRVFVNDQLWGLYTHVETIDRRFLSRWFDSNDGMLYEGTYWCDLVPNNVPPTDNDDSKCLTREFSPDMCTLPDPGADPEDYSVLRDFVDQIAALPPGGFFPEVQGFIDFDRLLTMWALESIISHWDNYTFNIKNNYRVYHDPTSGRWTVMSTGIDQIFKQNQDPWAVDGVLATRCLQDQACEDAFAERLDELNQAFPNMGLAERAETIFQQVSPFVQEDPRKEYSFQTFQGEHQQLLNFLQSRPQQIDNYLNAHGY